MNEFERNLRKPQKMSKAKNEDIIIRVPSWCQLGKRIEFQMQDPSDGKMHWFKDRIISYDYKGFFHQAPYCPVYYNKFSDYGKTVRECEEVEEEKI